MTNNERSEIAQEPEQKDGLACFSRRRRREERSEIAQEDVAKSLWRKYRRTAEYKSGRHFSINSVHPLVREAEEHGLNDVILQFARELERPVDIRIALSMRKESDWIDDWKRMHSMLFRYVYRQSGELRPLGHDVRFGDPGDEDLHHVPRGGSEVYNELYALARTLRDQTEFVNTSNIDEVCRFLAHFHYSFIRIHPFFDGNGRIARVVTDQLSVALGFVPIIAGFPRNNVEKKRIYHSAIRASATDHSYSELTAWIKQQLLDKLSEIA